MKLLKACMAALLLATLAEANSDAVATNFQASCSAGQITLRWTTLTKGRLFARVDADPPGVTWPPSPAFQQIETKDSSASFTVAPGSHVAYLTSLEADGSWPMGPVEKLTCPASSPTPAGTPQTCVQVMLDGDSAHAICATTLNIVHDCPAPGCLGSANLISALSNPSPGMAMLQQWTNSTTTPLRLFAPPKAGDQCVENTYYLDPVNGVFIWCMATNVWFQFKGVPLQ